MARCLVSLRPGSRSLLTQVLVVAVAEIYAVVALSAPSHAFTVASSTGYARAIAQAQQIAWAAGHRATIAAVAAPGIAAATAGSVVVRAVAGPIGWASLAVSAGLVLAAIDWNNDDRQAIRNNTAAFYGIQPTLSINGNQVPAGGTVTNDTCTGSWALNCQQIIEIPNGKNLSVQPFCGSSVVPVMTEPNWTFLDEAWPSGGPCKQTYRFLYNGVNQSSGVVTTPATPDSGQVAGYLNQLPANDPLSVESQTQPVGTTNSAPTGSVSQTDMPVSPTQMPTTVVPANAVPDSSAVVDPNAPAPTQQAQTNTQTATTTTTTNPDGSQTDTQTATVQCNGGQHDARTFGTVLQEHYNLWSASGLLGTLELIKNLTWPSTFPSYTLSSSIMGTFTFDFNAWAGVITALRTLVIAGAGFVAYRIIFVGGH